MGLVGFLTKKLHFCKTITYTDILNADKFMEENKPLPEIDNLNDIKTSKTSTSRFFFLLGFFGFFIFAWAGCYNLYTHKYDDSGKSIEVQPSSKYNPTYE